MGRHFFNDRYYRDPYDGELFHVMFICVDCLEIFEDEIPYVLPGGERCEKCFQLIKEGMTFFEELEE